MYSEADFPLGRIDRRGSVLGEGCLVRICEIPDVGFHGFDALDSKRYANLLERTLPISEFDEAGYAVIEMFYESSEDVSGQPIEPSGSTAFHLYHFCFDARDLERV